MEQATKVKAVREHAGRYLVHSDYGTFLIKHDSYDKRWYVFMPLEATPSDYYWTLGQAKKAIADVLDTPTYYGLKKG